jgi:hypothetical protein
VLSQISLKTLGTMYQKQLNEATTSTPPSLSTPQLSYCKHALPICEHREL